MKKQKNPAERDHSACEGLQDFSTAHFQYNC